MKQYTLFGIKPDGLDINLILREKGSELKITIPKKELFLEEIKLLFNEYGLSVVDEKEYIPSKNIIIKHYEEHKGVYDENYKQHKIDFLIDYLQKGNSYWIIFYGDEAIKKGREILTKIREKYLIDRKAARLNMTHASDSIESVKKEILIHFPEFNKF